MSAYKFKLESVLNYRRQVENAVKKELADLFISLEYEETRLAQLDASITKNSREMVGVDETTSTRMVIYNDYLSRIRGKIGECKEIIKEFEVKVDDKRAELIIVAKEKKMMETMKKSELKEFLIKESKMEQVINDEFNVNRFNK